jgi:hypothetical protein
MRKYGVEDKPRFSVKWPNGEIERFGTCNTDDPDRSYITQIQDNIYLIKVGKTGVVEPILLNDLVQVTNGFYDHEHTGWITPKQFLIQFNEGT